jgi:RHS repeat-associated protein/uncharacterized repeat protein (TIGR01451 family)
LALLSLVGMLMVIGPPSDAAPAEATTHPAAAAPPPRPSSQGAASVTVQAPDESVQIGELFTVAVALAQLDAPLSGFQFDLAYDASVVAYVGRAPDRFLGATGRAIVCPPADRPAPGSVRLACASTGPTRGPTGDGILAELTFRALHGGESDLTLSGLQLPDDQLPPALLGATIQKGHVVVAAEQTALTGVQIAGPEMGILGRSNAFTATGAPPDATLPVTYTWQATDKAPVVHTNRGLRDTLDLTWNTTGTKRVTVTAANAYGTVSATHAITVQVVFDDDQDGVPNEIEDGAPNGGDGNDDGIPDSQQATVASLPNAKDGRYVTLETSAGTLVDVRAVGNPSPGDAPAGVEFPVGFFAFVVQGLAPGGSTVVTVFLPPDVEPTTYYKHGPTPAEVAPHWYAFSYDPPTGAWIDANRVLLHLVDGERGDGDLTADGKIEEPGAPANAPIPVGGYAMPASAHLLLWPRVMVMLAVVLGAVVAAALAARHPELLASAVRRLLSAIVLVSLLLSQLPIASVRTAPRAERPLQHAPSAPPATGRPRPDLRRTADGDWADLDDDHDVDGADLSQMADHWNCAPGQPCYEAAYDRGGFAGLIDAFDLACLGNQYDVEPPQVSITVPTVGAVVGASLQVSGVVSDAHAIASVTVNGTAATVTDGAFEATISLPGGNQTINAVATDALGAVGTASRVVGVDGEGPMIEVHAPRDRQSVYELRPTVALSYSDFYTDVHAPSLQVLLTDEDGAERDVTSDLTIGGDGASGTVSTDLREETAYTLTASLEDVLGNPGTVQTTFFVPTQTAGLTPPEEPEDAGWVSGRVYDASTCEGASEHQPVRCHGLPGAAVRLSYAGSPTDTITGTVITGPDGFFAFPVGETDSYWLRVEKQGFTYGQREAEIVRQHATPVNEIYLTPLDANHQLCGITGCDLTSSDGLLRVQIPPDAISAGDQVDVSATFFDQVEFLPSGALPEGTWETYGFNVGGDSEYAFNLPITVWVSNTLDFPANFAIPLGFWNQKTQMWEHAGTSRIDANGEWVVFTTTHFSTYDCNDPVTLPPDGAEPELDGESEEDEPCGEKDTSGSAVILRSGVLREEVSLPPVQVLGEPFAPTLRYNSDRAAPSEVIEVRIGLERDPGIASGDYVQCELFIEGEKTDTFTFAAGDLGEGGEIGHFRYLWDGRDAQGRRLPPGVYEYAIHVQIPYRAQYYFSIDGQFGGPPDYATGATGVYVDAWTEDWLYGSVTLNADPDSPLGAGWALQGLQRLYDDEAGNILIDGCCSLDKYYFPGKNLLDSGAYGQLASLAGAAPVADPLGSDASATGHGKRDTAPRGLGHDVGAHQSSGPLRVGKRSSATFVNAGLTVTYTVAITNVDVLTRPVHVTDTLPAAQRPLGAVASQGSGCTVPGAWGAAVTCDLGDLDPGHTASLTLTVETTSTVSAAGLLVNEARASTPGFTETTGHAQAYLQDCHAILNDDTATVYDHVQAAVDAAAASDVVKVSGICAGVLDRAGSRQQLYLDKSVTVRGGYRADFGVHDPAVYPTTLDALGQGRVVVASGMTGAALDYVDITGGDGRGQACGSWRFGGGGAYLDGTDAALRHSRVFSNVADSRAAPGSEVAGGGVCISGGHPTLERNEIISNTARTAAGDHRWGRGGGVAILESSAATLAYNVIAHNVSSADADPGGGGGLYSEESSPTLRGNLIRDNAANTTLTGTGVGGGYYDITGQPTLINNAFIGNVSGTAGGQGPGLVLASSDGHLAHTTIHGNSGTDGSGLRLVDAGAGASTAYLTNTIVVSQALGVSVAAGSAAELDGVLWYANGGNVHGAGAVTVTHPITGNPAFLGDGYHLSSASAARDNGVACGVTTDIDGGARPLGSGFDLGADEYVPAPCTPISSVSVTGPTAGTQGDTYTFLAAVSPGSASAPITYTWEASEQPDVVHPGGDADDSVPYAWATLGAKTITVTAENCGAAVSGTHAITIAAPSVINTSTTWDLAHSPWHLTQDVIVNPGVTLTVEAGVTVMADEDVKLKVLGHLEAVGIPTQAITFTSHADSGPAQWAGLVFDGGTGYLRHVTVRYAGDGNSIVAGSNVTVRGTSAGEVRIESSELRDQWNAAGADYGLYVADSRVVVSDTVFSGNGNAADDWPIRLEADDLHRVALSGNVFSANAQNRVLVEGGSLVGSTTLRDQTGLVGYDLAGDLTVPSGLTLTVKPGVAVMGQDQVELTVEGHLEARGSQPITFTSSANSRPGQWSGLVFDGGTGALRHVTVRYGGDPNSLLGSFYGSNIAARDVPAPGLTIESSQVLHERDRFGSYADYGLYAADSRVVVSDTLLAYSGNADADYALYATGTSAITVVRSIFQSNVGHPLWAPSAALPALLDGNVFIDNGHDRIRCHGDLVLSSSTTLPAQTGLEGYEIAGQLTVPAGVTLEVEPGLGLFWATVQGLSVEGTLLAAATQEQPILFTSLADSAPGQWAGITCDGGTGRLEHATIRHAETGLAVNDGDVTVERGEVTQNPVHGIHLTGADTRFSVVGADVSGNGDHGLLNETSKLVDARYNWWGSVLGPYHAASNPGGLGDQVSDLVLFDPWLKGDEEELAIINRTATDRTTLTFDPSDGTYTRHYPDGSEVHFNLDGTQDYARDAAGNETAYGYDAEGRLTEIGITPAGEAAPRWVWTLAYASDGIAISDPGGRVTTLEIDQRNDLVAITDPDAATWGFTYDDAHRMTHKEGPQGDLTSYGYDERGRVRQLELPPRPVHDPDTAAFTTTRQVHSYTPTDVAYQLANDLAPGDQITPTDALITSTALLAQVTYGGHQESFHTDAWGFATDRTDGLGRTTTYERDDAGRPIRVTYPEGNCTEYGYDTWGSVLRVQKMPPDQCALPADQRDPQRVQTWTYTYHPRLHDRRTSETDPLGQTTTFAYDAAGNLVTRTMPAVMTAGGLVTPTYTYAYDGQGQRTRATDPLGVVTCYTYTLGTPDEAAGGAHPLFAPGVAPVPGLLTREVRDCGGLNQTTIYRAFDAGGHPQVIEGPGPAQVLHRLYDVHGRVISETNALGITTVKAYDQDGNLVRETEDYTPDGVTGRNLVTEYVYDAWGSLLSERTVADGLTVQQMYGYDADHNRVLEQDPLGNTTLHSYDAAGQRVRKVSASGHIYTYTHAADGQPATESDGEGRLTRYLYDGLRRNVRTVRDAGGLDLTTVYTYDLGDRMVALQNPAGSRLRFRYDTHGRRTAEIYTVGQETLTRTLAYDALGRLVQETDERGVTTHYVYDALGRRVRTVEDVGGLNLTTVYTYDLAGNLVATEDPRGTLTTYAYDALDRLVSEVEDAGGEALETAYAYDRLGHRVEVRRPDGTVRRAQVNAFGLPTRETEDADGLGYATTSDYDAALNLVRQTDHHGNALEYAYTPEGRVASQSHADGTRTTYDYNARGQPTQRTLADGQRVDYAYDGAGRLIERAYADGVTDTFAYDGAGRVVASLRTQDGHAIRQSYAYDAVGSVVSNTLTVDDGGASPQAFTTRYDHDYAAGRVTLTYPSGSVVVQETDALGRLNGVQMDGAELATWVHDDLAGRQTLTYANGQVITTQYDRLWRVAQIASGVADYGYGYDGLARRLWTDRNHEPGTPHDVYVYDGSGQLTQVYYGADARDPAAVTAQERTTVYSVDALRNRVRVDDSAAGPTTYGPNDGVRLTDPMHRYRQVDGTALTYDGRGNLTSDGTHTYTYNAADQLVGASGSGQDVTYLYDAQGTRVGRVVDGQTTIFVPDVSHHVLEERDGGGALEARYVYGPGSDDLLAMERGGQRYVYQQDALGSVTAVSDEGGALVERYAYDVYGAATIYDAAGQELAASAVGSPFGFTGRPYDPLAGVYDVRARAYHPGLGRFVQMDPLGVVDGLNLYAYADNAPTSWTDPFGLAPCKAKKKEACEGEEEGIERYVRIGYSEDYVDPLAYPELTMFLQQRDDVRQATEAYGRQWGWSDDTIQQAIQDRLSHLYDLTSYQKDLLLFRGDSLETSAVLVDENAPGEYTGVTWEIEFSNGQRLDLGQQEDLRLNRDQVGRIFDYLERIGSHGFRLHLTADFCNDDGWVDKVGSTVDVTADPGETRAQFESRHTGW